MAHDIIIRGGTVVDGTGAAGFMADVAVDGDRITAVGDLTGQWRVDRRFEPELAIASARMLRDRWAAAVDRAKGWESGSAGSLSAS